MFRPQTRGLQHRLYKFSTWIMKTRYSKYSFALRIHSDVRTKPIKTYSHNLHRRILASRMCFHAEWEKSLRKCILTLSHIGHTRTNNWFFKLVEALLQIHSCFFSRSRNVRGLPLSALTSRCITCQVCIQQGNKTPVTIIWSEPLNICCHTIVTK